MNLGNQKKQQNQGIRVKPMSRMNVRDAANLVRELLEINEHFIDVIALLEFKLPLYGITYDICEKQELRDQHGLSIPEHGIIKIREDVFEGAFNNVGRDRFTICHEVGHLVLHHDVEFSRSDSPNPHKSFEDSEWQANTFASEFMMPVGLIQSSEKTVEAVAETFGVSTEAADVRLRILRKEGLI